MKDVIVDTGLPFEGTIGLGAEHRGSGSWYPKMVLITKGGKEQLVRRLSVSCETKADALGSAKRAWMKLLDGS